MRVAPFIAAAVLVGSVTGCGASYSDGYRYGYTPQYVYAPQPAYYAPQYVYAPEPVYYGSTYNYDSKWDYYRNYNGSFHPGPEHYP